MYNLSHCMYQSTVRILVFVLSYMPTGSHAGGSKTFAHRGTPVTWRRSVIWTRNNIICRKQRGVSYYPIGRTAFVWI